MQAIQSNGADTTTRRYIRRVANCCNHQLFLASSSVASSVKILHPINPLFRMRSLSLLLLVAATAFAVEEITDNGYAIPEYDPLPSDGEPVVNFYILFIYLRIDWKLNI